MDNPYWASEGQRHHLSLESIRLLCFEMLCIFEANRPLVEDIDIAEEEEGEKIDTTKVPLLKLYQEHAFAQASKGLLQLALLVRTYDDQMKASSKSEAYINHLASIDDGTYVGVLSEQQLFTLREACNKIIHAHEVRPLYETLDRLVNDHGLEQPLWYLTGEIELSGTLGKQKWEAVIHLQPFIETVVSSLDLGDPV